MDALTYSTSGPFWIGTHDVLVHVAVRWGERLTSGESRFDFPISAKSEIARAKLPLLCRVERVYGRRPIIVKVRVTNGSFFALCPISRLNLNSHMLLSVCFGDELSNAHVQNKYGGQCYLLKTIPSTKPIDCARGRHAVNSSRRVAADHLPFFCADRPSEKLAQLG
ncbi:hypothetical protein [Mesorhizobium loti]|uniref:hypothetical protein n=1 Tax=Rhizobium loti TaxID=381 RepID=UPI0011B43DF0|nr:hypothetical protein [Mesorhizobium loti]